jgi:hypothetical protein
LNNHTIPTLALKWRLLLYLCTSDIIQLTNLLWLLEPWRPFRHSLPKLRQPTIKHRLCYNPEERRPLLSQGGNRKSRVSCCFMLTLCSKPHGLSLCSSASILKASVLIWCACTEDHEWRWKWFHRYLVWMIQASILLLIAFINGNVDYAFLVVMFSSGNEQ